MLKNLCTTAYYQQRRSDWYAGATPGEDHNNYVVLCTSGDNGKSWNEVLVVDPDAEGPDALAQLREPVNKFPDFVRYVVQRLRILVAVHGLSGPEKRSSAAVRHQHGASRLSEKGSTCHASALA